jgi:hypothetical protein
MGVSSVGVGGSPPHTLEEESHGCQEVATWVKLSSMQRFELASV